MLKKKVIAILAIIFFPITILFAIVSLAISNGAVYMDDSWRWGGRDNG